ncbi:MAG: sulfite exporter TauE/SafE family protein [Methanolinea sp.]|jgi:uncharacterized membrane protein YfcA|nr:sulfite exporter TauE/SafE family protein [Methanolinea sp.]
METLLAAAVLVVTGGTAGFASGLFGIGGGFLMTPVLYWLFSTGGIGDTEATRLAFGTSLAVIIPTMVSGTIGHHRREAVDWKAAVPLAAGAVWGGLFGGTVASFLPGTTLRTIFAVLVITMAVRMAWPGRSCPEGQKGRVSGPACAVLGFFIGTVSGLAGIGGGVLLVPLLVILFGFPVHSAIGTSSACLVFSSGAAVIAYIFHGLSATGLPPLSLGYVYLPAWAALVVTTVPLSRIGVRFSHTCTPGFLQGLLAVLMVAIGLSMLVG